MVRIRWRSRKSAAFDKGRGGRRPGHRARQKAHDRLRRRGGAACASAACRKTADECRRISARHADEDRDAGRLNVLTIEGLRITKKPRLPAPLISPPPPSLTPSSMLRFLR